MWEEYNLKLIIEAQDKFSAEMKSMQWEIEKMQVSVKKTNDTTSSALSSIKKWIAWLWLSAMVIGATKSMVTLADNLEKSKIAFTTMLWSGEKAEAMLKDLSDFAKKTPFELTWIRSSAQQLLAMWVQAKDMIPTLKSLWDVSAWLSVPLERLALNYGQVIAQWKLTGKELRDFTTAWVPLLDELASMLNKSTTAIQDMISKGQISSDIMVQAFQNMTSEWWKFANLMDQQATTLSWLWSNFQDSLASLWEEIGSELLPALKDYMKQMWEWLDDNMDGIKKLASEIVSTWKVIADEVVDLVTTIWWVVSDFASFINDIVGQVTDIVAWWMTDADNVTAQWLTWMEWNWHDFFYYVQQWITTIVWSLRTALNVADSLAKTVWKKSWWEWLYKAWEVNPYKRDKKWNLIYNFEKLDYEKKSLFETVKESWNWMKAYVKEWTKEVSDSWNNWLDEMYNKLEQNYVNQVTKLRWWTYSATKTFSDSVKEFVSDVNNTLDNLWWDSWSGWSSKATEKVEKMSDELKATIKEMEAYAKESENMRKATYEWIIDSMEEAVKKAEELAKEIVDLKKEINELNTSETWDIASAYIKAEETLKEYKKEYADIVDLANQYSKEELKNQAKDWEVLWFSAKDLLEVKNAYESMASAFEWLSEAQTNALQEQIKKQKEYNDLNDVQKIRADYEEKRQILEAELEEKIQAFQKESNEFLIAELKKETYEAKWLNYMKYSVTEQKKMADQLIDMYNRIASARDSAWFVWNDIEWRASWWDVYWNTPYIVGENWPELFVPKNSWTIVPNNEITNNNWITINISWVSVRNDNDIQSITDEIIRKIKLEKSFWIA